MTGAISRSFTYDAMGSLFTSSGVTREYDGRGRMKRAGTTDYLVNGLGQRVAKETAGSRIHFVYGESGELLGEYDGVGSLIQETIWFGALPVATSRTSPPSAFQPLYVWPDHIGTPRAVSSATGNLRWVANPSEPFGFSMPDENPQGLGVFAYNLRFLGQYFDSETGTHFNWMRDYHPSTGRYIESDPIGLRGGANTYGYVGGNPLGYVDPFGLYHYNAGPPRTVPVSGDTLKALKCTETCLQYMTGNPTLDLLITGGAEQSKHSKASHHYKGQACDIAGPKFNPITDDQAKSCAVTCGFGAGQFEQFSNSNRDHWHFQLQPGNGVGALSPVPLP